MKSLENAGIKVVKLLHAKGWQAFFVGGIVRNDLLKRPSDNVDIATDAQPDEVEKILSEKGFNVKPIGKKFGSVLTVVDDCLIEITTFRAEGRYSDNRHPDQVEFIREYLEDAKRRDFTVNALYFDPMKKEVLDPTNLGLKDIKAKLLRFVGDPKKRIDEDGLRMLRGVRLATQLGFKLEKNSFAAIKTRAKYIQDISGERIKAELDKILLSENRVAGLKLLDDVGLLRFIIPEAVKLKDFSHKSKNFHLEGDMFTHTLMTLDYVKTQNLDLLYALLFHDIGKPKVAKKVQKAEGWVFSTRGHAEASAEIFMDFAVKYKFSRQSRNVVDWLIRKHMLVDDFSEMRTGKQMELVSDESFPLLLQHWEADHYGSIRANPKDEHSQRFNKSMKAGRDILGMLKTSSGLILKLARGETIMKYTKLKPSEALGQKIEEVKAQIVLGKIRDEQDLKDYLKK